MTETNKSIAAIKCKYISSSDFGMMGDGRMDSPVWSIDSVITQKYLVPRVVLD